MNNSFHRHHGVGFFKRHQEQNGFGNDIYSFQCHYMENCHSLYSNKLFSHFGCVNAVEFSNGTQEFLASGGDDRRVLLWNVGQSIFQKDYKPIIMTGTHVSNIFCLAFDAENKKLLSSGNDEQVLVHNIETKQLLNVFLREDAVYSISTHPADPFIFVTASEDGRLRLTDTRQPYSTATCLANYVSAFHGVAFNPLDPLFVAAAHSKEGAALWDTRKPKSTVLCYGAPLSRENTMSVQFTADGSRLLVLRRKKCPRVYETHSSIPFVEGKAENYLNSCTMKSGCFAGLKDEYFVSGSDNFNVYVWKIPNLSSEDLCVKIEGAKMVLRGHRSIVNQVRYNKNSHVLVSSGVEKHLNLWSPYPYPDFGGQTGLSSPNESRQLYSRHQYIDLVLRSGRALTHDYESESTNEDPRMIAFFDSLLQHDQNLSSDSSDTSSDNDKFRMLPTMASSTRPDIRELSFLNSSSETDSSDDETSNINQSNSFISERHSRLQWLRESLRSADDNSNLNQSSSSSQSHDLKKSGTQSRESNSLASAPTTSRKLDVRSSDESDDDRHASMRKRNALRRKKVKNRIKFLVEPIIKVSPATSKSQPQDSLLEDPSTSIDQLHSSVLDAEAYQRSRRKLEESIEATDRKLAGIAGQMASAMERAEKTSDSSEDSQTDDNLSSKDDKL